MKQFPAATVKRPAPPKLFLGGTKMRMQETLRSWTLLGIVAVLLIGFSMAGRGRDARADDQNPGVAATETTIASPEVSGKPEPLVPTTNVFAMMREGGLLMWPLAFCSFVGLAFTLERLVSLRRSRVIPKAFVTRFMQQVREGELERDRAMELCQENQSPIATIFVAAVRKWGRPGVEVEQAVLDAGERATHGLRRYLRVFSSLTVIAPLVGLLGTVFGMIHAFNAVAGNDALGHPELLAKGISQALLNTAFGLTVAIPAQSLYFFFISRVDQLIIEMDSLGEELVNSISAEELQNRAIESRPSKPRRTRKAA